MKNLLMNPAFNALLLFTVSGEFILPWILGRFYKAYRPQTMVMSVLGSPRSPVRAIYNAWLVWLGCFLACTALARWDAALMEHPVLAEALLVTIGVFAIGAGLISGFFCVNESSEEVTAASKIHGVGSALGFTALLFFPLADALFAFACSERAAGIVSSVAFVLALCFFAVFIMGEKDRFRDTVLAYSGIWERMSLFCMYIPFFFDSIRNLFCVL